MLVEKQLDGNKTEKYVTQFHSDSYEFDPTAVAIQLRPKSIIAVEDEELHLHSKFRETNKDCLPELKSEDGEESCLCMAKNRNIQYMPIDFSTSMSFTFVLWDAESHDQGIVFDLGYQLYNKNKKPQRYEILETSIMAIDQDGYPCGTFAEARPRDRCFQDPGRMPFRPLYEHQCPNRKNNPWDDVRAMKNKAIWPYKQSLPQGKYNFFCFQKNIPSLLYFHRKFKLGRSNSGAHNNVAHICGRWVHPDDIDVRSLQMM